MSSPFEALGGYAASSNGVDPQRFKQSFVYLPSRRRRGAPTEIERHGSNSASGLAVILHPFEKRDDFRIARKFFDQVFHLIGHDCATDWRVG